MDSGESLATAFERLPGVLAGTVFLDPPAGPRVYLAVAANADQDTLRDAITALLDDHGIRCTPDRIHLATPPRRPTTAGVLPRASLDDLEVHRQDRLVSCTVSLRTASRQVRASATEPDTPSGRIRAAARATLEAAEGLDPDLRLGLQGIRVMDLFATEAVVLLIEVTLGRSQGQLSGTALVDRSAEEAACLAVLAALRSWTV